MRETVSAAVSQHIVASLTVMVAVWQFAATTAMAQNVSPAEYAVWMPQGDLPISDVSDEVLWIEAPHERDFAIRMPEGDLPIPDVTDEVLWIEAPHEAHFAVRMPDGELRVSPVRDEAPLRIAMPDDTEFAIRMPEGDLPISFARDERPRVVVGADEYGVVLAEQLPIVFPDTDIMTGQSAVMAGPWQVPWQDELGPWDATPPYDVITTAHEASTDNSADEWQATAGAPAWCRIHFWCPRPDMYQRHEYFPESHGRYYMHPYNPADIAIHQEFATSFGGDPRHPYSHEVFKELESHGTPEELPPGSQQDDAETNPASSQRQVPKRSGIVR